MEAMLENNTSPQSPGVSVATPPPSRKWEKDKKKGKKEIKEGVRGFQKRRMKS